MYALIEFKGKQYKAEKGAKLMVDKLKEEPGTKLDIDTVLLINNDGKTSVGTPFVSGAKVSVTVGDSVRSRKVIVYKHEPKKNYHKTQGHRQAYSYITVDEITG